MLIQSAEGRVRPLVFLAGALVRALYEDLLGALNLRNDTVLTTLPTLLTKELLRCPIMPRTQSNLQFSRAFILYGAQP